MVSALLVALGLASCGTAQATAFRITELDHATQVAQNGPAADITFHWTGDATPPFLIESRPGPRCDASCGGPTETPAPSSGNPIVWSKITFCSGTTPATTPPSPFDAYLSLRDARGRRTQDVYILADCYYTSVAVRYEKLVFASATLPSMPTTLRLPSDLSWRLADVARSLALAGGMVLLIAFPSQLFNSTLQAHYDEVMGWFAVLRRRRAPRPVGERRAESRHRAIDPWRIGGALLLSSALSGLLDPNFGFNQASLEMVLGALVALAFTTAVYTTVHATAAHRISKAWGGFHVYRGGIAIAVFCVLLSRLTTAQPGYMYGVILGYALNRSVELKPHHRGRLAALGFSVVLATSVLVWIAWSPVKTAHSSAFPMVVLSTAMSAIFVAGMTSLVFSLVPVRFLDGEHVYRWHRGAWLALFGAGMFLFVHVVLNAASSAADPHRSYAVAISLFVSFGVISMAFWAYFRLRPESATS